MVDDVPQRTSLQASLGSGSGPGPVWHRGADVVFAWLGGVEWASHFAMVHVAFPHVYFVGCQGLGAREENAASKQKVKDSPQDKSVTPS